MIIFPAIDLKDGQCVRLVQGKLENKTVYSDDPANVACYFQKKGARWLHIVDLDGAFSGNPQNAAAIKAIAAAIDIPFQVGGGLRTCEDVERLLELGATRVIIGTSAFKPGFMAQLLQRFGSERILLGLDAKNNKVAVKGWVEDSSMTALEFGRQMKALGIETAVYTDIARDGLLQGPNLASIEEMARMSGLNIIASGGVTSVADIGALKSLEPFGVAGAVIGKALYDGKILLEEALAAGGD